MARYIQYHWQPIRIAGKLKRTPYKLYAVGVNGSKRKVTPYIDENGYYFFKNPYGKNWIEFLSSDHHMHLGDWDLLFEDRQYRSKQ